MQGDRSGRERAGADDFDVVVVGGGPAGAAAAWQFARMGRRVALVEAEAFDEAGPGWVNGVPPWFFDEADIPRPEAPERRVNPPRCHGYTPSTGRQVTLGEPPTWNVDMRLLVARLQGLARAAGVAMIERWRVDGVETEGDRPTVLRLASTNGADGERALGARLFVDATGMRGAVLRRIPALAAQCPPVAAADICGAAQEVADVADPDGAAAFLRKNGAGAGEILAWTGALGGFSIVQYLVSADATEVELLAGTTADGRHPSALEVLRDMRRQNPWIGARRFGGHAHIPIRRPYARFAWPGLAAVGNAACHVFPGHASGVGAALVAARLLARAATTADPADPGSLRATWAYQAAFHRGLGVVHNAYDVFRRMSSALSLDETDELLGGPLTTPAVVVAALDQRIARLTLADLVSMTRGALRHRTLFRKIAPYLARMAAVEPWCHLYPERPDERALRLWARGLGAIAGVAPDPV